MIHHRFHFFLLFILIIPATTFAQSEGGIHGVVGAIADDSKVPDAIISLRNISLELSTEIRTGSDGVFIFDRLRPGAYTLTISHDSFLMQTFELMLRPREILHLTPKLNLRRLETAINVMAETIRVPSTHSPSSTLIDSGRIQTLPMAQRSNLTDMIVSAAPGMIRSHDDFVHVRGSEIALNTLINGVSFWENSHALFSSGMGTDYIASINVLTGGFSAEYGNRFAGILDIVTKSGFSMDNDGSLNLGVGTALRHNASLELGGHSDKAAYYLNVGGFESARFLSPPDTRSIHNTGRGARSFVQFDFLPDPSNLLKLILMGDGTNFELPKTAHDDMMRPAMNASQRNRSEAFILSWNHTYHPEMVQSTSFYQKWSQSHLLPASDPLGAIARSKRSLQTFGFKTDLERHFSLQQIQGGIDLVLLRPDENFFYQDDGFRSFLKMQNMDHLHIHHSAPLTLDEQKTGGEISVYLQDKIQVSEAFLMDVGLRYDQYSLATSAFQFSPRLNLSYSLDSGTILYASYNSFFVPPPVENILVNSAGLTGSIMEIGKPLSPLQPTTENQFELGVTMPILRMLELGVDGYYRTSNKPVHTVLLPDSRFYAYANFDKGKAYGLELRANIHAIPSLDLSSYINYALGRVYFWNPVTAGLTTEAGHIHTTNRFLAPMDQTHTLTAGLTYRHSPTHLWTSLSFDYGSGTPEGHGGAHEAAGHDMEAVERTPKHFTQNLTIGWDALLEGTQPRLTLQFNIENLSDTLYLIAQQSTFSPGQYSLPRMYSGSITIHF